MQVVNTTTRNEKKRRAKCDRDDSIVHLDPVQWRVKLQITYVYLIQFHWLSLNEKERDWYKSSTKILEHIGVQQPTQGKMGNLFSR